MNALKMMWDTVDGQLVCRWVDPASYGTELLLMPPSRNDEARGEASPPELAVAKAA